MGGIFGPTPTPHKKLTLCGTGILPVLKNAEAKRPNPYSPQKIDRKHPGYKPPD